MPPLNNGWLLDDLIARKRPSETEEPDLDEVLRESESLQNEEGLIPVCIVKQCNFIQRN